MLEGNPINKTVLVLLLLLADKGDVHPYFKWCRPCLLDAVFVGDGLFGFIPLKG